MMLETLTKQATAVNLVAASCMTILIYNHVLTLDQEIERIWPSRMSIAKALFIINRYIVETMVVFNCISAAQPYRSSGFCVFYLRWLTIGLTVSNAAVQGILVLRIWALYRHNKIILGITYFFYFGGTITLVGLVIKDYVGEEVLINQTLSSLPGCYATSVPSIIAGFWIGPLIVESILFIIVVSRAFVWWRDGTPVPRIMSMLATDSTVYFAIVFAMLLANYLVFELGPPFFSSLLVTPSTTAGCILGSYMFLNLRNMSLNRFMGDDTNTTFERRSGDHSRMVIIVPLADRRQNLSEDPTTFITFDHDALQGTEHDGGNVGADRRRWRVGSTTVGMSTVVDRFEEQGTSASSSKVAGTLEIPGRNDGDRNPSAGGQSKDPCFGEIAKTMESQ